MDTAMDKNLEYKYKLIEIPISIEFYCFFTL